MRKTYILFAIILILFVHQFPNYYAYINTPAGHFFSGQASWFDPWDINVYVQAIREGQHGRLLIENLYTTVPQKAALLYPFYTLSGYFFRFVNPFLLFHLLAIVAAVFLTVIIYKVSRIFIKQEKWAFLATLFTLFGGGFGWLVYPQFQSTDVTTPGVTFYSVLGRPHEAAGLIFYISSLLLFYIFTQKRNVSYSFFSLLLLIVSIFINPSFPVSYLLILMLFLYFSKLKGKKEILYKMLALNASIAGVIALFYYYYISSSGFSTLSKQILHLPGIASFLLGYGLFLPSFLYQLIQMKRNSRDNLFLIVWISISLVLSLLPLGEFHYFRRGLLFPLSLILTLTLMEIKIQNNLKRGVLLFIVIVYSFLTSFFMTYHRVMQTTQNNPWYYQHQEVRRALSILKKSQKDGVLSGLILGNYVPAFSGKHVYFGHVMQTPGAGEKIKKMEAFYSGKMTEEEALTFVAKNNIQFVIYSEEEKKLGRPNYSFLRVLYTSDKIDLYEINEKLTI